MAVQIFVSCASENRSYQANRALFDEFVDAVLNEVNQTRTTPEPVEVFHALRTTRVVLSFFSLHYFNSR